MIFLFGLVIGFIRSGFVIDEEKHLVTRFLSLGISVIYQKNHFAKKIRSVSVKKTSIIIYEKYVRGREVFPGEIKKIGYNVCLHFSKNEIFAVNYFFHKDKAIKQTRAIAEHFNVEIENPGMN